MFQTIRSPRLRHVLLALLACASSSCAAMLQGTKTDVFFDGEPDGGQIIVGGEAYDLPHSVELSKKTKEVTFRHADYPERLVPLKSTVQGGFVLMDILFTPGFGLSGILIDAATGAWNELPAQVHMDFRTGHTNLDGEPEAREAAAKVSHEARAD